MDSSQDTFFFASESVSEGHPDKLCDQVSDAILDACLKQDKEAKVAMETAVKGTKCCLLGEVTYSGDKIDFEKIARDTIGYIGYNDVNMGYDYQTVDVIQEISVQSKEIAGGVHVGKSDDDVGAGDQGLMFGYATDEWDTETLHPYSHYLSNKICERLAQLRHDGTFKWLRPDVKSQVIVKYKKETDGRVTPLGVYNVLISTQHDDTVTNEQIAEILEKEVIRKEIPENMLKETKIIINPSGSFLYGGPGADAGLTGRKIIVDTYGGWAPHGGGAFSGKDPTKVDRSAAYYGRYVAKSLVANKLAHRVLV